MYSGAMTALITPFSNGKLDESRFKSQVERQIRGGVTAIIPVGTTGESPTLSFEEHFRVIELAVQTASNRVKVIAGTGANSTDEAIKLHKFAKSAGADACLSVDPYYNKPSQEGLYRHFMTLSESVDLPIVLYTIPGRTGIEMAPATVAKLHKNANVPAIKWATGNLGYVNDLRAISEITIISGDDPLTLPLMSIGGTGVISVLSNLLPDKVSEMVSLFAKSDISGAQKIHYEVLNLTKSLFLDGNPVGIKYAMKLANLDSGEVRLPLVEASETTKKTIERLVAPYL